LKPLNISVVAHDRIVPRRASASSNTRADIAFIVSEAPPSLTTRTCRFLSRGSSTPRPTSCIGACLTQIERCFVPHSHLPSCLEIEAHREKTSTQPPYTGSTRCASRDHHPPVLRCIALQFNALQFGASHCMIRYRGNSSLNQHGGATNDGAQLERREGRSGNSLPPERLVQPRSPISAPLRPSAKLVQCGMG
jgi:hypothetical protein